MGTGGHAGASGAGGSSGGSGGGPHDSGVADASDCNALVAEVNRTLIEAQKCSPTVVTPQCKDVLKGICCDEPVNSKDSMESVVYQAALDRYNAARCQTACPAVVCPGPGTPTKCVVANATAGQCRFGP
jgi:hypothetical protein